MHCTGARRSSAETTIHAIEKLTDQKRVVTHELRFMAPQHAGTVLTLPNLTITSHHYPILLSLPYPILSLPQPYPTLPYDYLTLLYRMTI